MHRLKIHAVRARAVPSPMRRPLRTSVGSVSTALSCSSTWKRTKASSADPICFPMSTRFRSSFNGRSRQWPRSPKRSARLSINRRSSSSLTACRELYSPQCSATQPQGGAPRSSPFTARSYERPRAHGRAGPGYRKAGRRSSLGAELVCESASEGSGKLKDVAARGHRASRRAEGAATAKRRPMRSFRLRSSVRMDRTTKHQPWRKIHDSV